MLLLPYSAKPSAKYADLQFALIASALVTCCRILQLIRDEIRAGKSDKEIYKKLEEDFGETVLYAPRFDYQTAALWLSPVSVIITYFSD